MSVCEICSQSFTGASSSGLCRPCERIVAARTEIAELKAQLAESQLEIDKLRGLCIRRYLILNSTIRQLRMLPKSDVVNGLIESIKHYLNTPPNAQEEGNDDE